MFFTYECACTAIHRSYVPQLALNEKVCVPETCNSLLLADYLSSFDMSSQPSTMTKKKRIAEVGRSLRRSSTMNLCSKQAQLEQVAQDNTQLQFQISPGTETPQTFQAYCSRVWLPWPQWKGFFLCLNVISSVWMHWLSLVLLGLRLCKLRVCSRQSSQPLVCNQNTDLVLQLPNFRQSRSCFPDATSRKLAALTIVRVSDTSDFACPSLHTIGVQAPAATRSWRRSHQTPFLVSDAMQSVAHVQLFYLVTQIFC